MGKKDQLRLKYHKTNAWARGKWKGFAALLLVLFIVAAEFPAIAFAGTDGAGQISQETGVMGMEAALVSGEDFLYPTNDLIHDEREVTGEEIPEDIPIYGNTSFFSLAREDGTARDTFGDRYGYMHLPENGKSQ